MIYQSVKTPLCDYLQTTSLHYWLENKIHVAMTNILATESRQTLKVGTKMASLHPDKYGYVVPRS